MQKKLYIFSFVMTAFPLILAGTDSLDQDRALFGTIYVLCGLIYVSLGFFALKRDIIDNLWVSVFGSIILMVVAYDYYVQGKRYLPYAYLGAAILSLLPSLVKRVQKKQIAE